MSFYAFLPKVLNMSLTASVGIVFVLLLRILLKKAPKLISYALWSIVLIRLLCPISIVSSLSIFGWLHAPAEEKAPLITSIEYMMEPINQTNQASVLLPPSSVDPVSNRPLPQDSALVMKISPSLPMRLASDIWLAGIAVMALHALKEYLLLRKKLRTASLLKDNIYLTDEFPCPFVMGLWKAKIYLPSSMEDKEQAYILLHEQYHIKRFDPLVKALAYAALCIHWFNPLVWLAFNLSGKDMEMSCDEAVIKKMGEKVLADYTASLLSLAIGKRIIAGMPLLFGEGDTKGRIRHLVRWKRPVWGVIALSLIICLTAAICLLTNPKENQKNLPDPFGHSYRVAKIAYEATLFSFSYADGDAAPQYSLTSDQQMFVSHDPNKVPLWQQTTGTFTEVHLSPLNFQDYFKDSSVYSGWDASIGGPDRILRNMKKAWRLTSQKDDTFFYLILMNNGDLYLAQGYDTGSKNAAQENGSYIRWLFQLERTDLITCRAMSKGQETVIQPNYYPGQPKWEEQTVPLGTILKEGQLHFTIQWNADELIVHEQIHYQHEDSKTSAQREHRLQRNENGEFILPVSFKGSERGYALYDIFGQHGYYGLKLNFAAEEETTDSTHWVYAPNYSAYSPVFDFKFHMAYTKISASCDNGKLVEYHFGNGKSDHSLTFPFQEPISWSPVNDTKENAKHASIRFTVETQSEQTYHGTIYIRQESEEANRTIYSASLVADGLHLSFDDWGNGILTLANQH